MMDQLRQLVLLPYRDFADQTCHLTYSQHSDTWITSPSTDPITTGVSRVATTVPVCKSLVWLEPGITETDPPYTSNRNWQTKVPETWKVTQLSSLRQESVKSLVWLDRIKQRSIPCLPRSRWTPDHLATQVVYDGEEGGGDLASSLAFPSYISGVHHFGWDACVCDRLLIQPLRLLHSVFVDGVCRVCFCWRHSPV